MRAARGPEIAPSGRLPECSVFLPALDEAENLPAMLADLLRVLPRVAARFEIVVVDDGSTDATAAVVADAARRHPALVRLVRHDRNRGYGAALKSGFAACRYGWIFFTDADRQFDLGDLATFVSAAGAADVVVGYRALRADPAWRRAHAAMWNRVVRLLVGVRVRDVNCAFKLFRRDALRGVSLRADGAAASAELMAQVDRAGARVVELPVAHRPRRAGVPTGGAPRVIARAVWELVAVAAWLRADAVRAAVMRALPSRH